MRTLFVGIAAVLASAHGPVLAANPSNREAVTEVADAIEHNYFDADAAHRIAVMLKAEAAAGRYDGQSPAQLATTLSARLVRLDHHFHVAWRSPADGRADVGSSPPSYGPEDHDRRGGYGFRQVAILSGNLGYIDLAFFAPIDFSQDDWPALKAAQAALELVSHTDALIVDLRDNGGGDPSMVGYLASAFVDPKQDIYNVFHGRSITASEHPAKPYAGRLLTMPLYILTSGRTGSAAESFAYTLQAAERATIVGEATIGAANPGSEIDLPGGYSVFVSQMSPVNPITHANWEGKGVIPNQPTSAADALDDARIEALSLSIPKIPVAERIDAQRALEAARAVHPPRSPGRIAVYAGQYGPTAIVVRSDGLQAIQGHRPPLKLAWIGGSTFFPLSSPNTRYIFDKKADGSIQSLTVSYVDGSSTLLDRSVH